MSAIEETATEAPAVEAVPKRAMTLGTGASLVILALLIIGPMFVKNFIVFQLTMLLIYALAVLALNILTGGSGQGSPFDRTPKPRATITGAGIPLVSNLPAAATSGLAFLMQPGGDILLDAIIGAAEASGTAKLMSRPHVVTQNNVAAEISQGTQIPVQTNVNNTISVSFLTFALKLNVTPQITEAGTILMTVEIENSQPDFARSVNGVPSVSTQSAKTTTLVADGTTMMIGGIYVDTDSLNIRQVPGLGSIPIIGHMFKNTSTIKSTAELLFFITPRIRASDTVVAAPAN